MARRPRTPSPLALAALGLAGALGAAAPATAQEPEPAPVSTPLPQPEPEAAPVATEPEPAEAPVPQPAEAPRAEAPAAVPAPEPPAPVPAPAAPAAAPAPEPSAAARLAAISKREQPAAKAGAEAGSGAQAEADLGANTFLEPEHERREIRRPKRRPKAKTKRRKPPARTPGVVTTPADAPASGPAPAISTPTGDDPLAAAGRVPLRGELLERFRIPPFLLPIYQAAGTQYGIRWEILAAINEIETDYGRNLNVSSAGAQGWMQFMPATWKAYGTDANRDGRKDPYNPVDAIFAAARYLKAAGAHQDLRKAIFAYNHANWYVDSVLMRAKLIAELPTALVDGLTGLTHGRFPVLGPAKIDRVRPVSRGGRTDVQHHPRRGAVIFTEPDAPIVAVQDGRIVRIAESERLGRHIVLEDAYGNRYTYAQLSRVARTYPVPHKDAEPDRDVVDRELPELDLEALEATREELPAGKERVFANPGRPAAAAATATVPPPVAEPYTDHDRRLLGGLDRAEVDMRPLRVGSEVMGGTVLGHAGRSPRTRRALVRFEIRPGSHRAPRLDPVPFLDGLRLVQRSGLDRRFGRGGRRTIGQILLMGKDTLRAKVLADERITITGCMREDVRSGVIDRRVLATLQMLAASGLNPTVTSLRCNHGLRTSSGNISHHSTGTAVDIGAINGTRIQPSTQGPGSVTEQTIRRLLTLQGSMAPAQIISLMTFEGAPSTLAMSDHADHIHIGWRPNGDGHTTGRRTAFVGSLSAGQWRRVADRLADVGNPTLRSGRDHE